MTEFDLRGLISAPIVAVNEAESDSAASFVELLHEFAFETGDDGTRSLKELSFAFDRVDADGETRVQRVVLPLIHFVPMGGLSIQEATLNYSLRLDAEPHTPESADRQVPSEVLPRRNAHLTPVRMVGHLAEPRESGTKLSGNINIELKLKQIDLPQGALSLLETTQAAISMTTEDSALPGKPTDPTVPSSEPVTSVELKNVTPRLVELGATQTAVLDFVLNPDWVSDKPVTVQLSSWPIGALNFGDRATLQVAKSGQQAISFKTEQRETPFAERTQLRLWATVEGHEEPFKFLLKRKTNATANKTVSGKKDT